MVVKDNIEFDNLKYVGDPVELAKRYDAQGVDELVFLDISASIERRDTMVTMVEKIWRAKRWCNWKMEKVYDVVIYAGREYTGIDAITWAKDARSCGDIDC